MADEYTPTTDFHMRIAFVTAIPRPESGDVWDRWQAAHDEAVRQEVRERIARQLDAEQRRARAAHQAAPTDHFAHDYCRWVGHAEALGNAARIVRGATRG